MSSTADNSINIINEFMKTYEKEKEIYELAAQQAEDLCRGVLKRESVECMVTSRVKDSHSLEKKLHARLKKRQEMAFSAGEGNKGYNNIDDIRSDIADLIGVRIALYMSRQKPQVEKVLRREFEVPWNQSLGEQDTSLATQPRLFPGYCADHYRVFFKPGSHQDDNLGKRMIEIQVVSVLRHVWAEIQHDMVYKQLIPTTEEDKRILDALSSLIYTGDFVLGQLFDSQAVRNKSDGKPYTSVFQLGNSLTQWIGNFSERQGDKPGDVQSLFRLLRAVDMDTPKALWGALKDMDISRSRTSDYMALARQYEPLHLSISNYIMHRIIWPRHGQCVVQSMKHSEQHTDNDDRYKISVVANAFILLDQLFYPPSGWTHLLYSEQDLKRQKEVAEWMSTSKPWRHCHGRIPLHQADQENVNELWACFNEHDKEPIRFVFHLSQILVLKGSLTDWSLLSRVLYPLINALELCS
ncbi:hypothetical protein BDV26DRAFT_277551 [Aspergillus bertholletiae]|uniref:RelA/SpoT domain-containing protein n=1 Tax=Aspergillus bertholletiae TaxID=1226010 RepID=A0A5N7BMN6_9EURO|nr:hypothetical protein BDV26DRAFT_277551 [Aspergillus bertholletiae]